MRKKGLIIGVGFQKTGTSSLRESLKLLGYRVKDMSSRALFLVLKGKYKKILKMLENYDAAEDFPWFMIYKKLDELIPNSKFILTIRDEESWYLSIQQHIGDLRSAHHEWIYGRGKGLPKYDKQSAIDVYNKHNQEVVEYFRDRPNDLLIIDFTKGEKWEKLCAFLNKEIPDKPFPHYNKSDRKRKKMSRFKYLRKQVKNYFKILYLDYLTSGDKIKST